MNSFHGRLVVPEAPRVSENCHLPGALKAAAAAAPSTAETEDLRDVETSRGNAEPWCTLVLRDLHIAVKETDHLMSLVARRRLYEREPPPPRPPHKRPRQVKSISTFIINLRRRLQLQRQRRALLSLQLSIHRLIHLRNDVVLLVPQLTRKGTELIGETTRVPDTRVPRCPRTRGVQ